MKMSDPLCRVSFVLGVVIFSKLQRISLPLSTG